MEGIRIAAAREVRLAPSVDGKPHNDVEFLLAFAHLAFCAAAILARPSALTFLRFRAATGRVVRGNPRLSGFLPSVSRALTFTRRSISVSMAWTIASSFMLAIIGSAGGDGLSNLPLSQLRGMSREVG